MEATHIADLESGYRRLMDRLTRALTYIGIVFLIGMMLASVIDVAGRFFFNKPLPGTYEIVQYTLIGTVFFCLGHVQLSGGNIVVEVVVDRLPQRAQDIIQLANTIIATALFAYFSWASILQVQDITRSGSVSGVLNIPDFPFAALVAMGYIVLTLVLVSDILVLVDRIRRGSTGVSQEAPII